MRKVKIFNQLATPHDLKPQGREEIARFLNPLVADALALYVKTKHFHWHLFGPHFRDYHELFDEQAAQILAAVDPIAERVRKLGHPTIRSIQDIARLQRIEDDSAPFKEAQEMLSELLHDNKAFAAHIRSAHDVCSKHRDVATCSLLEVFLDEAERRVWFLFETLAE